MLRLRATTRTYDDWGVVALDSVDLDVWAGQLLAITGPSGSGKSTLLNVMGLLDRPDSGTVEVAGTETARMRQRARARLRGARIGFLFQDGLLDPALTSVENVVMGLRFAGVPSGERVALARAALAEVGLTDRADAVAATLSGGERQRVALARSLAHRPPVLLCDEPTGNLDDDSSEAVFDLLASRAQDAAVVIVTHDTGLAGRCQAWAQLRRGALRWVTGA